ncbi:uncharacterized protein LOC125273152, partial [Megalobrama amblycephala]|uniref:uncharacterized protein LOC125273152 n=1 Tax=Megalobrama amblycephala TaxID=75352 RepID=UPI002014077F
IRTSNRFSPLSDAPTENPVESALVIGDSITRNMKIETPATIVTCLPGARAPDIKANLKVLANANRKYSKIIIHVGTNDVRLRQSEITKINIKEVCELASTMSGEVICSGPLPVRRSDEIVSRLSSLNGWLSKWCPQNNIGFIDNWKSFWGRPDLLKRDGIHPSRDGAALLSSNMAHSVQGKEEVLEPVEGQVKWKGPGALTIPSRSEMYAVCKVECEKPLRKYIFIPMDSQLPAGLFILQTFLSSSAIDENNFRVLVCNETFKDISIPMDTVTVTPDAPTDPKIDPNVFKFGDSPIPADWEKRLREKLAEHRNVFSLEEWNVG